VTEPAPGDVMGSILFGDGAAAVVVSAGGCGAQPEVVAGRSLLWPDSVETLQMHLTHTGPRFVLSRDLPSCFRAHLRAGVEAFLGARGLRVSDLCFYVVHPGGPRVLDAVAESLGLCDPLLRPSWEVWECYGNLSSTTVFFILQELQRSALPKDGELGLMLAVGPGLTCEMVLLRWRGRLGGRG
jgi:alkylresorcinol/alkylpyrone synthase